MTVNSVNKNTSPCLNKCLISTQVISLVSLSFFILVILSLILPGIAASQDENDFPVSNKTGTLTLVQAAMCEEVRNRTPYNPGIVFSSTLGKVICFTDFDPVLEKTFVYHKYYFMDELSAKIKLTLNPPRWATRSSIQLRETDKGPWRVEIVDAEDNVLYTLRFSITD
jgi:hypothetical protein